VNAQIAPQILDRATRPTADARELLTRVRRSGLLTARGEDRVLRVARTIADLAGSERVRNRDIGAAVALRPEPATGHREPS
jgi:magnesium chelatase family protein